MTPLELAVAPSLKPILTHQFDDLIATECGEFNHHAKMVSNCSVFPFKGKLLIAYRSGWLGSKIFIAEVDQDDFSTFNHKEIVLNHPLCVGGREDPRLFVYQGRLHLSFIGARFLLRQETIARQLFAVLDDELNTLEVFEPEYLWTTKWEKNWQPFVVDDRLFCVYKMTPRWKVIEIVKDDRGKRVANPVNGIQGIPSFSWQLGHARGGAAPVKHGNEFYSFFHCTIKHDYNDGKPALYPICAMTFSATYPFQPMRIARDPIFWPNLEDLPPGPHGNKTWYAATAYPCGAFFDAGKWAISYGYHDHACRISAFDFAEVEERLEWL